MKSHISYDAALALHSVPVLVLFIHSGVIVSVSVVVQQIRIGSAPNTISFTQLRIWFHVSMTLGTVIKRYRILVSSRSRGDLCVLWFLFGVIIRRWGWSFVQIPLLLFKIYLGQPFERLVSLVSLIVTPSLLTFVTTRTASIAHWTHVGISLI